MTCTCSHSESFHGEKFVTTRPARTVYKGCKFSACDCAQYVEQPAWNGDKITPEDEKLARKIIGQCQQVILKNQQMIDDIRRWSGLKS